MTTRAVVYVGSSGDQAITALELDPRGAGRVIESVAVPYRSPAGSSLPLAVSPDRRFLFAAVRTPPFEVATFRIDSATGRLSYVASGSLAASMAYIATDRTGSWLLSASYDTGLVTVNPIGSDGVVGTTRQFVSNVPKAHSILAAPSNKFVLYASLGGDVIHQGRFDPGTGALTPNEPPTVSVATGAGPRHFVFSPAGDIVYLLNELDGSIYVFPYDALTGTLAAPIQIASAMPDDAAIKPWAADIHLTPDGRFLYASERTSSTLAAFRVDAERGTLTRIGTYPTATQPRSFATAPSGRFLLAVGEKSNSMTSYAIDHRTGELVRIAETHVGENPDWLEIV